MATKTFEATVTPLSTYQKYLEDRFPSGKLAIADVAELADQKYDTVRQGSKRGSNGAYPLFTEVQRGNREARYVTVPDMAAWMYKEQCKPWLKLSGETRSHKFEFGISPVPGGGFRYYWFCEEQPKSNRTPTKARRTKDTGK